MHLPGRDRRPAAATVLSGDCSILLGCLLVLRRGGRDGLAFLGEYADFYVPHESPICEEVDMALGRASGEAKRSWQGSAASTSSCATRMLFHDHAEVARAGEHDTRSTGVICFDLPTLQGMGVQAVMAQTTATLTEPELADF